jgi:hypothetical protein
MKMEPPRESTSLSTPPILRAGLDLVSAEFGARRHFFSADRQFTTTVKGAGPLALPPTA